MTALLQQEKKARRSGFVIHPATHQCGVCCTAWFLESTRTKKPDHHPDMPCPTCGYRPMNVLEDYVPGPEGLK